MVVTQTGHVQGFKLSWNRLGNFGRNYNCPGIFAATALEVSVEIVTALLLLLTKSSNSGNINDLNTQRGHLQGFKPIPRKFIRVALFNSKVIKKWAREVHDIFKNLSKKMDRRGIGGKLKIHPRNLAGLRPICSYNTNHIQGAEQGG